MSAGSTSGADWWSHLEPTDPPESGARPEDPRLREFTEFWSGGPAQLRSGQPVLLGFPCDEGVRRNHGRPGAAQAPSHIRQFLYRLTPWDGPGGTDFSSLHLLDCGNLKLLGNLEEMQKLLGE